MDTGKSEPDYLQAFRGSFRGVLRWEQLADLWENVRRRSRAGWYAYTVGEPPPRAPLSPEGLEGFLRDVDQLLRREHDEDYCGIVYADDLDRPSFVKIFNPRNLGVVCGFSEHPPLPGWTLSTLPPIDLPAATAPAPTGFRRLLRALMPSS